MVVPKIRGPQYRPQHTIVLIMGIPKKVPLILGNPPNSETMQGRFMEVMGHEGKNPHGLMLRVWSIDGVSGVSLSSMFPRFSLVLKPCKPLPVSYGPDFVLLSYRCRSTVQGALSLGELHLGHVLRVLNNSISAGARWPFFQMCLPTMQDALCLRKWTSEMCFCAYSFLC